MSFMARTLSEILIEADDATDVSDLINLWNEIAINKYSFCLVEIRFANEHIRSLTQNVKGSEITKWNFNDKLENMYRKS